MSAKKAKLIGKYNSIKKIKNTNYKNLIEENIDVLAVSFREHGKTLDDAKGSVVRGLEVVEFACVYQGYLRVNFLKCRH